MEVISIGGKVYAKEIIMYWCGGHDASFEVVFGDGTKRLFHFMRKSEGFSEYVLAEHNDTFDENPLFQMTVTYKTKVETAIPKCLRALRHEFMAPQWDDPNYNKEDRKTVYI